MIYPDCPGWIRVSYQPLPLGGCNRDARYYVTRDECTIYLASHEEALDFFKIGPSGFNTAARRARLRNLPWIIQGWTIDRVV
jgi:hypothetical protein